MLIAVPVAVRAAKPPASVGTRPYAVATPAASQPATPPGPAPSGAPARAGQPASAPETPGAPGIPTSSARLADLPPVPEKVPPRGLSAPSVGIAGPVDAVGVRSGTTAMEIPDDVRRSGWYRFGPAPGDPQGVAIITAHVDSARDGPGVFFRLRELAPGARVEVELADGRVLAYEVTGREQLPKGEVPGSELFRRDGPPALALVTCGGAFDRRTGHYTDNVIVWSRPVEV